MSIIDGDDSDNESLSGSVLSMWWGWPNIIGDISVVVNVCILWRWWWWVCLSVVCVGVCGGGDFHAV